MRNQIIRTICFMSITICLSAGLCIAASWELVYTADVLPDDKSLGKEAWERGKDGQWPGKPEFGKIEFGALSSAGIGEAYWDYIAYTTQGAFSPDELRSGLPVEFVGKLTTSWAKVKSVY